MVAPEHSPADKSLLARLVKVLPGEGRALALATGYFFFLMLGYYLLRPLREAMGIARGADKLPWLMTGTLVLMLLANPAFAALVSRLPRRRFIPLVYRFFALNLLIFFALFQLLPGHGGTALGYTFYVWLSVYNLFVVSVFWGFMADLFEENQGKRLFGFIAMGGTLGAIVGAGLTEMLSKGMAFGFVLPFKATPAALVLVAAGFLELAVQCVMGLARRFHLGDVAGGPREPGPGLLEGLRLIRKSPYLTQIALYMLFFTLTTTFLYMAQGTIVAKAFTSQSARAAAFARIDLWVNLLTLVTQLFFTSRLITTFGLRPVLVILPVLTIAGFGALWVWPVFAVLAVFQVARRGLHYAVDRPAREILYIALGPDEKYKSKPFIDTFIYRGGDFLGAWAPALLAWMALPVAGVAMGLSALWFWSGSTLGRLSQSVRQPSDESK
ncbi:MAG: hypothetical protein Q8O00_13630 [Holophaga sp.]|nr:hypothetical protein [Holophaga sp.]